MNFTEMVIDGIVRQIAKSIMVIIGVALVVGGLIGYLIAK